MESGPSGFGREARQVAVAQGYLNGRNNSVIASCSGTSGKNGSRWQQSGKPRVSWPLAWSQSR